MKTTVYRGDYDKSEFYSVMGKYFAEKRYRDELPYIINSDDMTWYLFFREEPLAGFASVKESKHNVSFGNMFVEEGYRGSGTWSHMADCLIEAYRGKTIQVTTNNPNLIKAWERRGFVKTGSRGSYSVLRREPK